jgi:hypothetical protein
LAALGDVAIEPFWLALRSVGLMAGEPGQFLIVLTDDYLRGDLRMFNEKALHGGRPWLLVKPVGSSVWLGPLFRPGKTACWECLAQRLRANRPAETYLRAWTGRTDVLSVSHGWNSATLKVSLNLAAGEVVRWVVRGKSECEDMVIPLDVWSGMTQTHAGYVSRNVLHAVTLGQEGGPSDLLRRIAPRGGYDGDGAAVVPYLTGSIHPLLSVHRASPYSRSTCLDSNHKK